MAERWQQWMPHDIDAWQGSANVQALSDLAYRAVHNLLQDMWKQADCALPVDDRELAKRSRVAQRWAECRDEVLEYFYDRTDSGKLTHRVLLRKWKEAQEVYAKRRNAAQRTNASRSGDGDRDADRSGDRHAPPTHEQIQGQEQNTTGKAGKPLASTAPAVPAERGKLIGRIPVKGKDAGEVEIFEADAQEWQASYPAVDVRQELRELKQWCVDNPNLQKTRSGVRRFINAWMAREQDKGGRNGTNRQHSSKGVNRLDQALAELAKAGVSVASGGAETGTGEVRPVAGRGDGRDPAGVVLDGAG